MSIHIGAKPGEVAERILMPGDPLRAKYIAENFLSDVTCYNKVRGMLGFTGTYKGVAVSTQGSGMGIPSFAIYINELFRDYGVKTAMRVGTCGAMRDDVLMKDIILAQGCCTDNDFNHLVFPGTYAPVADFEMLRAAWLVAKNMDKQVKIGNVIAGDMFYMEASPKDDMWAKYGVIAGEMESSALFTYAKKYGARAATLLTVSDSSFAEGKMTSEEREKSLNDAITIALETVIQF